MFHKIADWRIAAAELPADAEDAEKYICGKLRRHLGLVPQDSLEYRILNKGTDSRRGIPEFVFTFEVVTCEPRPEAWDTLCTLPEMPAVDRLGEGPVVVGAGPAGLFAAYVLAAAGKKPVIFERGAPVEERVRDVEAFTADRKLDPESNLLFGEGGAGTFSDGKLYTRIRDKNASCITDIMIACGADKSIRYLKRPHLGSDRLPGIVAEIRKKIIAMGGRFFFHTRVEDLLLEDGICAGVVLADGRTVKAPAVICAHGSSARDLTRKLIQNVACELKPFQIGTRIEHPQLLIDRRQYRCQHRPATLEAAEYFVSWRNPAGKEGSGVASFCMCPGGAIVAAGAVPGQLSTNGMSNSARDGKFANACLVTTLPAERFATPEDAFVFLERLERKAFAAGGGNYDFPAQSVKSYLANMRPELSKQGSGAMFSLKPYRMKKLFPAEINAVLPAALKHFDKLMSGFTGAGTLVGIETTVSSPVRIPRDENGASPLPGFRCAGEGGGHAGGIISAACDGFKQALLLLEHGK